jgi:hypothetical protein
MKSNDSTKLLVVALLICVCTLYTSLSHAGGIITDDFSGTSINTQLWSYYHYDDHQRCLQEDGVLKIQIDGASSGPDYFGAGVGGNFLLKGNFEIVIDYALSNWPEANGVGAGITFMGDNFDKSGHMTQRSFGADEPETIKENYVADFQDGESLIHFEFEPVATTGKMKLTRVGSVMAGYFFNSADSSWVLLGSHDYGSSGLDDWLGFGLNAASVISTYNTDNLLVHPFAGKDVEIVFDNFQLTYDQIKSTAVPIPGTLLLLGSGLLGLAGIGRRSKKG